MKGGTHYKRVERILADTHLRSGQFLVWSTTISLTADPRSLERGIAFARAEVSKPVSWGFASATSAFESRSLSGVVVSSCRVRP